MTFLMRLNPLRRSTGSHAPRVRRLSRHRISVEALESRLVLSTITWSGSGDGTNWNTATNWVGNKVPGSSDDAVINVASGVTIQLPAGGISVDSLKQSGGTLVASSGTIASTLGVTVTGGTFDDNGGSITGGIDLINSTLSDSATAGAASITNEGRNSQLTGTIPASQTVRVEGGGNGEADLTLDAGSANMGTILLQSGSGSYYASNLIVASGSTFTNAGTVTVNASNENSSLTGSFDNKGTLTVSGSATLVVGTAGLTFTQDIGGTLSAPGVFDCDAGTLLVKGGTVSGSVRAHGCALDLASTITTPTTVYAVGQNTTLVSNDSPSATVWVQGNGNGEADLTLDAGAANLGTILLQSTSGSYQASNLVVASGSTFTNAGTVTVNASTENSNLTGSFTNAGTVTVSGSATLVVGTAGLTFTQQSGTLSASGVFDCDAGTLLVKGGTVSGSVRAHGCALDLASTITTPTTVYAVGQNTTLVSNDSPSATVWVQGNGNGEADLTLDAGAANLGTILLQSTSGSYQASNLVVASGSTFTNAGTVTVNASTENSNLTGSFTNAGTVTVSGSATLVVGTAGLTFTQDVGGTLSASGVFDCDAGTLLIQGGAVSGTIHARGCALDLAKTITTPTTVYAVGQNTTLVSNDSPQATVWVQGGSNGVADLTLDAGAANLGTILLQSTSGSYNASNLVVASGSTFTNAGTITVNVSNEASNLTGNLTNQGSLNINGTTLILAGTGSTLVNQPGGVINASGTLNDSATSFTNNGTLIVGTGATSLTISGAYVQSSTGAMDIEIGGTTAGTLFDQVVVKGQAILDGTLNVSLLNGFKPVNGNSFKVLTFASASGTFANYIGTNLANGLVLQPSQTTTALTLTAAPAPVSDLGVTVNAQYAQVTIGSGVLYTVTVTNNGPDNATGVTLLDTLPSGSVVINSITPSTGSYTVSGNVVTVSFGTLGVKASDTLTILVTPSVTGTFTDSASVSSSGSFDSSLANNTGSTSSVVVPPPSADLQVAISPPATVTANGQISFVVVVSNAGPNAASSVNLLDTFTLPQGATIVSATASQGSATPSGNAVNASFGTIANGAGVSLTVIVTTTANGSYAENVSVSSTTSDPFPNNNSTSLPSTPVQPQASLSIAVSPSPVIVNHPVTITATVSVPAGFTASLTGTVTFYLGTTIIGSGQPNASGQVILVYSAFPLGSNSISAQYSGDPTYVAPTSAVTGSVTVNPPATTSTTLMVTPSSSVYGQSVTLKATVTKDNGTGTVTFLDGTTVLGTAPLTAAGATLSLSSLATGMHSLSARYGGSTDGTLPGSQSLATSFQVIADSTSAMMTASTTSPSPTQAVSLTAQVSALAPGSGIPVGMVTFYDGSTSLGSMKLDGTGHATLVVREFALGTHLISVSYAGNTNDVGVRSGSTTISVSNHGAPVLFDEQYYLLSNPDVAAAVRSGAFTSGYQHYVEYGQYEGRNPSPYFNEAYYLATNPDVAAAVKAGVFTSGFFHYVEHGQFEGRNPSPYFNETFYLSSNPDVAAAVKAGGLTSGFEHFVLYGQFEDRAPTPAYDETYYLAHNPDVASAVASGGLESGYEHYVLYGQQEGRVASALYNEKYYLAHYPDIAAAVKAGSFVSGYEHFVEDGLFEGRIPISNWNEAGYLAANPDVASAIAHKQIASGFEQYVLYGRFEGRVGGLT